jgi:hypothetical protein
MFYYVTRYFRDVSRSMTIASTVRLRDPSVTNLHRQFYRLSELPTIISIALFSDDPPKLYEDEDLKEGMNSEPPKELAPKAKASNKSKAKRQRSENRKIALSPIQGM